ncbi:MAG: hypothetical protein KCHDKBKB_02903 [Elusimicrobia bacterium]|nr:hypothetical protein [Elusimicrobiota bacterium]
MNKKLIFSFIVFSIGALPLYSKEEPNSLQLRIEPAYISPNDDGLKDQLFIYPVLQTHVRIKSWTVDILTKKNHRRVARLSGSGFPALIKWDGLDRKAMKVQDGAYLAKMSIFGIKKTFVSEQSFWVDTRAPEVGVSLSTQVFDRSFLDKGQLIIFPQAQDASPLDQWLIQVIGQSGVTVHLILSSGTIREIDWDGTDRNTQVLVPQGDYRVIFQAWDAAGNESFPAFSDFKANVTPREMLGHSLRLIQVNETDLGLIVSIGSQNLFHTVNKKLELSETGKEWMREVAILANAYPQVNVKVDGYSRSMKKSNLDQELSSVYAWRVYSHLTKIGNVKASRLTVKGRGRSPMFDRRAAGVPVVQNGVEIILEGGGPW